MVVLRFRFVLGGCPRESASSAVPRCFFPLPGEVREVFPNIVILCASRFSIVDLQLCYAVLLCSCCVACVDLQLLFRNCCLAIGVLQGLRTAVL
jgi:hypothetical protein